jgi:hypothetical protein
MVVGFAVVVAWCSVVLYLRWRSPGDGLPARVVIAEAAMVEHFRQVQEGTADFGDLDLCDLGWTVVRVERHAEGDAAGGEATTVGIVARPQVYSRFRKPWAERWLLLDFSRYIYKTYLLRSDGLFCTTDEEPVGATGDYTPEHVEDAESSGMWNECNHVAAAGATEKRRPD